MMYVRTVRTCRLLVRDMSLLGMDGLLLTFITFQHPTNIEIISKV